MVVFQGRFWGLGQLRASGQGLGFRVQITIWPRNPPDFLFSPHSTVYGWGNIWCLGVGRFIVGGTGFRMF